MVASPLSVKAISLIILLEPVSGASSLTGLISSASFDRIVSGCFPQYRYDGGLHSNNNPVLCGVLLAVVYKHRSRVFCQIVVGIALKEREVPQLLLLLDEGAFGS